MISLNREVDIFKMRKIFEINLGVIMMLFDDSEELQIEKMIYLLRNELFFYIFDFYFIMWKK